MLVINMYIVVSSVLSVLSGYMLVCAVKMTKRLIKCKETVRLCYINSFSPYSPYKELTFCTDNRDKYYSTLEKYSLKELDSVLGYNTHADVYIVDDKPLHVILSKRKLYIPTIGMYIASAVLFAVAVYIRMLPDII